MRTLALDLGQRRIGVAISDELGVTAQGLDTIERTNIREDLARLSAIIRENQVDLVLIGNPLHMSGQNSPGTALARRTTEVVLHQAGSIVPGDEEAAWTRS